MFSYCLIGSYLADTLFYSLQLLYAELCFQGFLKDLREVHADPLCLGVQPAWDAKRFFDGSVVVHAAICVRIQQNHAPHLTGCYIDLVNGCGGWNGFLPVLCFVS